MWTEEQMDEYTEWLDIQAAKYFLALEAGAKTVEQVLSYMRARLPINFDIDRDYVKSLFYSTEK